MGTATTTLSGEATTAPRSPFCGTRTTTCSATTRLPRPAQAASGRASRTASASALLALDRRLQAAVRRDTGVLRQGASSKV